MIVAAKGIEGSLTDERDLWAASKDVHEARQRSRRPVSIEELRQVARIYREHEAGGAPTQAVATLMAMSARTAARRVQKAREKGLLPAHRDVPAADDTQEEPEAPTAVDAAHARWRELGFSALTREHLLELIHDAKARGRHDIAVGLLGDPRVKEWFDEEEPADGQHREAP